ncbi:conserved serine-threonine rich protein [Penicillium chermesinum]|uniref:Conserved serine-threonine rich protein n=1 Tax=Penicillium chermesinum TaxID=63820 RepID=A0A9W9NT29_9EURO|nr:conserved serine-threonine rich protein [Penicillium chermesinum]KAJ5225463.1 conserved serine-threonine rich protein [Penicillium chermesinum]KAJ6161311.1 conserved serine-threonine rich protein [Penicillium chermesinum]
MTRPGVGRSTFSALLSHQGHSRGLWRAAKNSQDTPEQVEYTFRPFKKSKASSANSLKKELLDEHDQLMKELQSIQKELIKDPFSAIFGLQTDLFREWEKEPTWQSSMRSSPKTKRPSRSKASSNTSQSEKDFETTTTELSRGTLRYDPISGRMVPRQDEATNTGNEARPFAADCPPSVHADVNTSPFIAHNGTFHQHPNFASRHYIPNFWDPKFNHSGPGIGSESVRKPDPSSLKDDDSIIFVPPQRPVPPDPQADILNIQKSLHEPSEVAPLACGPSVRADDSQSTWTTTVKTTAKPESNEPRPENETDVVTPEFLEIDTQYPTKQASEVRDKTVEYSLSGETGSVLTSQPLPTVDNGHLEPTKAAGEITSIEPEIILDYQPNNKVETHNVYIPVSENDYIDPSEHLDASDIRARYASPQGGSEKEKPISAPEVDSAATDYSLEGLNSRVGALTSPIAELVREGPATEQESPVTASPLPEFRILTYNPYDSQVTITGAEPFFDASETRSRSAILACLKKIARLEESGRFMPYITQMEQDGYEILASADDLLIFRKVNRHGVFGELINESDNDRNATSESCPSDNGHTSTNQSSQSTIDQTSSVGKTLRRVLFGGVVTAAFCYTTGVVSEYFRTGGADGRGPDGFTPFEVERRYRE